MAALNLDEAKNKENQAIRHSLPGAPKPDASKEADPTMQRKITVQADRDQDFLTIKKMMFTVTEAGAEEINFAVMKKEDQSPGEAPTN